MPSGETAWCPVEPPGSEVRSLLASVAVKRSPGGPVHDLEHHVATAKAAAGTRASREASGGDPLPSPQVGRMVARFAASMRAAKVRPVPSVATGRRRPVGLTGVWRLPSGDGQSPVAVTVDGHLVSVRTDSRLRVRGTAPAPEFAVERIPGRWKYRSVGPAWSEDQVGPLLARELVRLGVALADDVPEPSEALKLSTKAFRTRWWMHPPLWFGSFYVGVWIVVLVGSGLSVFGVEVPYALSYQEPRAAAAVGVALYVAFLVWAKRNVVRAPRGLVCPTCGRLNPVRGYDLCTDCRRKLHRASCRAVY